MSANTIHPAIGTDELTQSQAACASTLGNHSIEKATGKQPIVQSGQKTPQTDAEKRIDYCLPQQLQEGTITTEKSQIGSGGSGNVYKGRLTLNDTTVDVAIKSPKTENDNSVEKETKLSQEILTKAKNDLETKTNLVSNYEGLHFLSFQHQIDDKHVQILINGQDGQKSIRKPTDTSRSDTRIDLYNTDLGNPKDILQASRLALEFIATIHSLHQQGIVHGDIKIENIMISIDDPQCPHCYVIDIGEGGKSQQDKISSRSYNCAPEIKTVKKLSTNQDIFAAGTVLCELLLGSREIMYTKSKKTQQWVEVFSGDRHPTKQIAQEYGYKLQKPKEAPKFLKNILNKANQLGDGETLYPPVIFNAIEDLIVQMCAIEPKERPSSQYCLAVLNDIALCAEAIQNGIEIVKPMVTGTLSQAMQLISDLNALNKKKKLTPEEQATKEVLIYNLKRDFEISHDNRELKSDMQEAIANVTQGQTLKEKTLQKLYNECKNDIQTQILSALKARLEKINTSKTQEIRENIETQLQKAKKGETLDQSTLNKIRAEVELLELQNNLKNLNAENKSQINDKIENTLQRLQQGEVLSSDEIEQLKLEADPNTQIHILTVLLDTLTQNEISQETTITHGNITEAIQNVENGKLLTLYNLNQLRTNVMTVQTSTLQGLKTQLEDIDSVQANELKDKISEQLETAEKRNLIKQDDINRLRKETENALLQQL